MQASTRALLYLIPLALLDSVIPVPIVALVLIYVIASRPAWFANLVGQIYGQPGE